jgi:hypothetical protein
MIRPLAVLAFASSALSAQSFSDAPTSWAFTASSNGGLSSAAVGASRWMPLGESDRFLFGLGMRASFLSGTANALPYGSAYIPRNVHDTLFVSASAMSLNITAHLAAKLGPKLLAGLDFDLLGYTAGGSRLMNYRDSVGAPTQSVGAKPASPNIFGGASSSGIAATNLYLAWPLAPGYALRGGYSRQSVNYNTDDPQSSNTQNFRVVANMMFLGLVITPER